MSKTIRSAAAFAICASLSLVSTRARAQQSGEPTRLVETVDVRVINIDVVVTDKKGIPVQGLTKDDFSLFENGRQKPVSNFYEVEGKRAIAPTAPAPAAGQPVAQSPREETPESLRRRIIFFVDNLSLAPFNRNRVFTQMKEFAKSVMRPGDEAMVATYNRSMKVRVQFTRDPVQIQQTLDAIAGESALGLSNLSERKDVQSRIKEAQSYDDAMASARTYASSVEHDLRQSVESLNALMSTLAGVEGKKIMVLTSEGFPMQPGREIFTYIDELAREKSGWQSGGTMLQSMTYDAGPLIQSVAKTANANGITLYALHAGGLSGSSDFSAENSQPTSFTVAHAASTNTTDSLQLMAEMTGGLAATQTNNYAEAFRKIQRDLDSYYSLGYRAGTERVDRQRQIEVRVKNRDYVVRSRQTFVEKSTFAEMSDRVIANLLYRSKANDLKIIARISTPRSTDDELFRVPVEIQIPMESLTLIPQGESTFAGGFDVFVVVANKDNDLSDVSRKSHQILIPSADMAKIKGKYYTYSLDLLMERGINKISIGVVDAVSNTSGFAREQIIAQDLR